jgi:hypothetical protein
MRYTTLKFGKLKEGQPKPKGKIKNPEIFAPGVRNGGIENIMSTILELEKNINILSSMRK